MNDVPYIPPKTAAELAAAHPAGTRHAAMIRIATSLLGNRMPREAVFITLRQTFPDPDKTDKEIHDIIQWVEAKNPSPSGFGPAPSGGRNVRMPYRPWVPPTPEKKQSPEELVGDLVGEPEGSEEADWSEKSPVRIWDGEENHAELLLTHLYGPGDYINIVTDYTVVKNKDGHEKSNPQGAGEILSRDEWLSRFREAGIPVSEAGAWVRPNPTKATGSGKNGAICDADIASHRFLMIESDILSVTQQMAVYDKLRLPIAALIHSAGDSVHAWIWIQAKNDAQYEVIVTRIYGVLEMYGFDRANKNPSRLSRLPGVKRVIGGKGDGQQRLIYLNPKVEPLELDRLEAIAKPCQSLVRGVDMTERMIEFIKPKPKPFTLSFLEGNDQNTFMDGFYFRDSEVTIWSGVSSHGKSTMLGTIMVHLMAREIPIFVCSMEHRLESLCILILRIALGKEPSTETVYKFQKNFGHLYSACDLVGSIAPQRLLDMMRSAHHREGAKHFFIDSLMRVQGLEEEYPAQGDFMTALTKVAMETDGHVHLVAHPRKVDEKLRVGKMDVKGSVSLIQGAFNVVTMRRNLNKRDAQENGATSHELNRMHDAEFLVEKQNASGWTGAFKLAFDPWTRQFTRFTTEEKRKPITLDPDD